MSSFHLRRKRTFGLPSKADMPQPPVESASLQMEKPAKLEAGSPKSYKTASAGRPTQGKLHKGLPDQHLTPLIASVSKADTAQPTTATSAYTSTIRRFGFAGSRGSRTPSLVSGSSAPSLGSPALRMLRRKPSTISKHVSGAHTESVTSHEGGRPHPRKEQKYIGSHDDSVLGIALPPPPRVRKEYTADEVVDYESNKRFQYPPGLRAATYLQSLTPPSDTQTSVGSPSILHSSNLGPFSHVSTSTSVSSLSPGPGFSPPLTAGQLRTRPNRDVRDTMLRKRGGRIREIQDSSLNPNRLSDPQESSTSSSSGSTVKMVYTGRQSEDTFEIRQAAVAVHVHNRVPDPACDAEQNFARSSMQTDATNSPQPARTPPELAHLLNDPQSRIQSTFSGRPRPERPSRDGTPELLFQREVLPVIQSNLPRLQSTFHKRQTSAETTSSVAGSATSSVKSLRSLPPRATPRYATPSPNGANTTSRVVVGMPGPHVSHHIDDGKQGVAEIGAIHQLGKKSASRFGFFPKLSKADNGTQADNGYKTLTRKGPVAGTGHEGYTIHGGRGRSGSTTSASESLAGSVGANSSSSSDNARTSASLDSVRSAREELSVKRSVLERPSPMIDRGKGSSFSNDTSAVMFSSESSRSSHDPGSRLHKADDRSRSNRNGKERTPQTNVKLLPSISSTKRRPDVVPENPDWLLRKHVCADDDRTAQYDSRTDAHRSPRRFLGDGLPASIPSDVSNSGGDSASLFNESEESQHALRRSSDSVRDMTGLGDSRDSDWPKARSNHQQKLRRKLTFFQRAQNSPRKDSAISEVAASIAPKAPPRSIAHYAIFDSPEPIDYDDLEEILQEAQRNGTDETGSRPITPPVISGRPQLAERSSLRATDGVASSQPSSPRRVPENVASVLNESANVEALPKLRPSRLAQIGRIPPVISVRERDQDRKLADRSFSRPFAPSQPRPMPVPSEMPAPAERQGSKRHQSRKVTEDIFPIPHAGVFVDSPRSTAASTLAPPSGLGLRAPVPSREFLAFPSRQNSELSYTSSSGLSMSMRMSNPEPPSTEDEIWDEYDDFIDDVLSPKTSISTGSSLGAPFQYANNAKLEDRETPLDDAPTSKGSKETADGLGISLGVPTFLQPATPEAGPSLQARESGLLSPPQSAKTITTAMSLTDFYSGYGERNTSGAGSLAAGTSASSSSRVSSSSVRSLAGPALVAATSSHAWTLPNPEAIHGPASKPDEPSVAALAPIHVEHFEATANLRYAALMTSKWLSFGRVLFSPAHLEVNDRSIAGQNRILVLDGLGKDWSYYCALTYPDAEIYNLTQLPASSSSGSFPWPSSLSNHHLLPHPSLATPFPFPRGFFGVVVLRFPAVAPESHYRQAISECKRVLRPGGYIELSILDIDVVSVGNRMRRELRRLKVQIQAKDAQLCLKNGSDVVIKMLGHRGFEGLQRCFVGLPIAGRLAMGSPEKTTPSNTASAKSAFKQKKDKSVDGLGSDEGIAQMVSKVGRWWYSRCYEAAALSATGSYRSIFADPALLEECEHRGTTFRLMLAHAQKPLISKRRTASV